MASRTAASVAGGRRKTRGAIADATDGTGAFCALRVGGAPATNIENATNASADLTHDFTRGFCHGSPAEKSAASPCTDSRRCEESGFLARIVNRLENGFEFEGCVVRRQRLQDRFQFVGTFQLGYCLGRPLRFFPLANLLIGEWPNSIRD